MFKEYYPYERFRQDTKQLLVKLRGFEAEAIVGIARGGLTLAHALAEGLVLRDVQTLRTELYDITTKRELFTLFENCDFQDKHRVLVVDDIADSGETLKKVMHSLETKYPDIEFKTATLFYKKSSVYEPHFWVQEATAWVDFFWEADFMESK